MTLCVMVLIASEFMPVSLLTPIASDLGITEGQAGQAISISGVFAVVTSLLIAAASQRLDRRRLLLSLTGVTVLSGVLVARRAQLCALHGRSGLAGNRHRRLLVDVHGDHHATGAC